LVDTFALIAIGGVIAAAAVLIQNWLQARMSAVAELSFGNVIDL
jgi:hypothetical protein